jgi:hypothetical protein
MELLMLLAHHRGNALLETIVALLALLPLITGMVLLGKQLDLKHKTYDALRYSVWERTVWSDRGSNTKSEDDISMEALDRSLGHPHAGLSPTATLRTHGGSQNPLWQESRRSLLAGSSGAAVSGSHDDLGPPVRTGYALVPGLAHGDGPIAAVANTLQLRDLGLNARTFTNGTITANVRPILAERAKRARSLNMRERSDAELPPFAHSARGALLSDAWTPRDEGEFRRKVDSLVTDEILETLEMPGRPLSMQALRKGGPLYGEGQYSFDPDLRPRSNALPSAYVTDREDD